MNKYFIKARHLKDGTHQICEFENVDDFIAQLRLWVQQDIDDEKFHNTYMYECFVRVEKDYDEKR